MSGPDTETRASRRTATTSSSKRTVGIGAVVALALAAGLLAWVLIDRSDDPEPAAAPTTSGPAAPLETTPTESVSQPTLQTIAALRARYPGRRLVAVFEPRTNTSRRRVFQREYAEAFEGAGQAVIAVVPDTPIYSITGEVTERFSAHELADDLRSRGIPADAVEGVPAIVEKLARECREGDVVAVMSNGDFGNLWQKLLEKLRG